MLGPLRDMLKSVILSIPVKDVEANNAENASLGLPLGAKDDNCFRKGENGYVFVYEVSLGFILDTVFMFLFCSARGKYCPNAAAANVASKPGLLGKIPLEIEFESVVESCLMCL